MRLGILVIAMTGVAACSETRLAPIRAYDASLIVPVDSAPGADGGIPLDVNGDLPSPVDVQVPGPDVVAIVCPPIPGTPVGFAVVTGGELPGTPIVTVRATSEADLKMYAAELDPRVIEIGTRIVLTGPIEVASNKTIKGVSALAELTGSGLMLKDSQNVIVQQLKISRALGADIDAITVQNSQNIWIDHCDLSSGMDQPQGTYDGLVDIVHASDFVTVSWTVLHDHYNVSVVGHSASAAAAAEDTGHLRVTFHHNWFSNVGSNTPRVRFGRVHVFNNFFDNIDMNAIASVMGAQVLVERNYFENVPDPVQTMYMDPDPGAVNEFGDIFDIVSGIKATLAVTTWVPPYLYASDEALMVKNLVEACAGPRF